MAGESSVFLHLTPEELVVLYERLVPPPSALPYDDLLPPYTEEQRVVALDVARRGLVARLLLDPATEGVEGLNPVALAAAASTLLTERAVGIVRVTSDGETQAIDFYRLDETTRLMHTMLDERLHQFVILGNAEDYREAIRKGLGPGALDGADGPEITLDSELFDTAVAHAANGNAVAAQRLLEEANVPGDMAVLLTATLSGTFEITKIVASSVEGEIRPAERSLGFLSGAGATWLADLKVDGQSQNRLHIQLLNDARMHGIIQDFLNPPV